MSDYEIPAPTSGDIVDLITDDHRLLEDLMRAMRDESADRENPALVINTTVQMVVQSGEGLRADRSILAWKGESGRPSLLRLVRDVRFRALCWKFNTSLVHRGRLFYDGAEPYVPPDGVPLAAYQLTFHFRAAGRAPLESDRVEITVPAEAG